MRYWESGRNGEGGGVREVAELDAGNDGPQYYATETGDARVGKLSCAETRRNAQERGKGHEWVSPPGRTSGGGWKGWSGLKKNSYRKISNGA